MSQSRLSTKDLGTMGQEAFISKLRGDTALQKRVLEDLDLLRFSFGKPGKRGGFVIELLLRVQPALAAEVIWRKDLREATFLKEMVMAQPSVEISADAAMMALQDRSVYLLPAFGPSRRVKYIAHSAVIHGRAASFAFDYDELCNLENRNGGTLEDHIRIVHRDRGFLIRQPDPHARVIYGMAWRMGQNGESHY